MHLKLWPLAVAAGLGIVDGLATRDPQPNDADDDEGLTFEPPVDPRPRAALYELVMAAPDDAAWEIAYAALPVRPPPRYAADFRTDCMHAWSEVRDFTDGQSSSSFYFDKVYNWLCLVAFPCNE